jgi:integrase
MFQESKHGNAPHKFERDASIPVWSGWYGLRRGAGTVATAVEGQLAAKTLLRHRNIATTQQYYISSVDATAVRAVDKISALFDNRVASERPN